MSEIRNVTTGIRLLSALRKSQSYSALSEVSDEFFADSQEELAAFRWMCAYVREYRAFPSTSTMRAETGIQTVNTVEPLNYYLDDARQKALYYLLTPQMSVVNEAMMDKDPLKAVESMRVMDRLYYNLYAKKEGVVDFSASLDKVTERLLEARFDGGMRGIISGFPSLDAMTGGYQNGDLISWVGRPGMGKTYLLLQQAHQAWLAGKNVVFVTMEMTAEQVNRRLIGIESRINPDYIRKGCVSTDAMLVYRQAVQRLKDGAPFHVITGSMKKSVAAIRASCDEFHPDIVFVDAAYLLTPEKKRYGNTGRRETVSDVAEELKTIAVDIDRPIIQSVQFNRQAVKSTQVKRHTQRNSTTEDGMLHLALDKIGETDVIGQVSSVVIGIDKPDPPFNKNRRHCVIIKGREGESGVFTVKYEFTPVDFSELTREELAREVNGGSSDPSIQEQLETDLDWR